MRCSGMPGVAVLVTDVRTHYCRGHMLVTRASNCRHRDAQIGRAIFTLSYTGAPNNTSHARLPGDPSESPGRASGTDFPDAPVEDHPW